MKSYSDKVIALAGICQSASLVPQLAHTGTGDSDLYYISIKSLFNISPVSALDVFGEMQEIKIGLAVLEKILSTGQSKDHINLMHYIFGSVALANKLRKNPNALKELSKRLARIQTTHGSLDPSTFPEQSDTLSYTLGGIYSDIISPLTTKIRVTGKMECLQNTLTQAKIRTALFACVRAGMLWYQLQGSRWQFLFSRQKLIKTTRELLAYS